MRTTPLLDRVDRRRGGKHGAKIGRELAVGKGSSGDWRKITELRSNDGVDSYTCTRTICVLPDHLHAVWSLPPSGTDFSLRWSLIKSGFSRGLVSNAQRNPARSPNVTRKFGNAAIGNMRFAMTLIWRAMSITFTTIL
jgi:hypothetical protein